MNDVSRIQIYAKLAVLLMAYAVLSVGVPAIVLSAADAGRQEPPRDAAPLWTPVVASQVNPRPERGPVLRADFVYRVGVDGRVRGCAESARARSETGPRGGPTT